MTDQPITNTPSNDKYLPLYILVSKAGGEPDIKLLDEIIKCVHENFPVNENNY